MKLFEQQDVLEDKIEFKLHVIFKVLWLLPMSCFKKYKFILHVIFSTWQRIKPNCVWKQKKKSKVTYSNKL